MSIHEALYHHNAGTLITLAPDKLHLGWIHLNNKINYMEMVIKDGGAAPDALADLRKYREAREEIARLKEARAK